MKHIMSRDDNELIKKVFLAQKETTTQGDFKKFVQNDVKELGISYEEIITNTISKSKLKTPAKDAALKHLLEKHNKHNKIKHINCSILYIQPYLKVS